MMNIFRVNVLPRTLLAILVWAGPNFNAFMNVKNATRHAVLITDSALANEKELVNVRQFNFLQFLIHGI